MITQKDIDEARVALLKLATKLATEADRYLTQETVEDDHTAARLGQAAAACFTAALLEVPFRLVVDPGEAEE